MPEYPCPEADAMNWLFGWNMAEFARVLQDAADAMKAGQIDDAERILTEFNEQRARGKALDR